jgi:hypothetical protein
VFKNFIDRRASPLDVGNMSAESLFLKWFILMVEITIGYVNLS